MELDTDGKRYWAAQNYWISKGVLKMDNRNKYIGGSDISSVMGLNRWKTPLQLWSEKTGKITPEDVSEKEAVEMGHELEDTVARLFTKRTGMKVRRAPKRYVHKNVPYFSCQVDRLVEGTDELLECKTASAWKLQEWEGDDIPQEYILQVMWQLGITGRKTGHIAVLIGGQKFLYKKIDFDPEMWKDLMEQSVKFWEMVQDNIAPMAMGDDNKFLVELFPKEETEDLQEVEELNASIGLLQQLKNTIKETIEQKEEIEAKIKQVVGDNLGIMTSEYKVTWKHQTSSRVDTAMLKQDGLYDAYTKHSESRVLRVRKS